MCPIKFCPIRFKNSNVQQQDFNSEWIVQHSFLEFFQRKLNSEDKSWDCLSEETNAAVLSGLLWSWLSQLQVNNKRFSFLPIAG